MEKIIWVVNNKREEILGIQRKINEAGSMKAICILSADILKRNMSQLGEAKLWSLPTAIILDGEMVLETDSLLTQIKSDENISEVPVILTVPMGNSQLSQSCRQMGVDYVFELPLEFDAILEIEKIASEYDDSRNIEELNKEAFFASIIENAKKQPEPEADVSNQQPEPEADVSNQQPKPEIDVDIFLRELISLDIMPIGMAGAGLEPMHGNLLVMSRSGFVVDFGAQGTVDADTDDSEEQEDIEIEITFEEFLVSGYRRGQLVFENLNARVIITGCNKVKAEIVAENPDYLRLVEEMANGIQ